MTIIDLTLEAGQIVELEVSSSPSIVLEVSTVSPPGQTGDIGQTGPPGPEGPQGPVGPVSAGITLIFEFGTPAMEFIVDHNTNSFPSVTVVDSTGDEVDATTKYVNGNRIIVTSTALITCDVYLN